LCLTIIYFLYYILVYIQHNKDGSLENSLALFIRKASFKDQAVSAWWIHHMCFTHLSTYTTLNVQAGQQPASRAKRIPSTMQRHEIRQFASRSLIATLSSVVTRGVQTRVRALQTQCQSVSTHTPRYSSSTHVCQLNFSARRWNLMKTS